MSARVSWLTLAMTCCCFPSVPKFANKSITADLGAEICPNRGTNT